MRLRDKKLELEFCERSGAHAMTSPPAVYRVSGVSLVVEYAAGTSRRRRTKLITMIVILTLTEQARLEENALGLGQVRHNDSL
jgi:hypothetical protein